MSELTSSIIEELKIDLSKENIKIKKPLKIGESEYTGYGNLQAIRLFPTRDVDFKCFKCKDLVLRCSKCLNSTYIIQKLPKFEIDCTVESGEEPEIKVQRTIRDKTNKAEIFIWFKGNNETKNPYHFERLEYWTKHPKDWENLGNLIFTPQQAYQLAIMLLKACKVPININLEV